jgi:hypothetical protein
MSELTIRHEIDCDADTYWRCVWDEEYNRRLYMDVLKFRECTRLMQEEKGDQISRRIKLNPPAVDLPAPVAKAIGDIGWIEEGTFDKKTGHYKVKVIPASLPEKTHIFGELWCESRGPKRVERIAKMNVEVKVFMIGGIVEKRIIDDMKKSYEAAAKFTNEYVKEKGW